MAVQIIECEQGSPEWFKARLGIPTASEFSAILSQPKADGHLAQSVMDSMVKSGCTAEQLAAAVKAAKKKTASGSATRRSYLYKLVGEIITGEPEESFSSFAMERGNAMEAEARDHYALLTDSDPIQVGFVRNGPVGWSPDSLMGSDGALEIKTQRAGLLVDTFLKDEVPPEHKSQVQGGLWVGEREWIDLFIFWPKMVPLTKRIYRDELYIKTLAGEVDRFRSDLADLVAKMKARGATVAVAA